MKKSLTIYCEALLVVQPGLEPRLADPESDVLPLHHWTYSLFLLKAVAKVRTFFILQVFLKKSFVNGDRITCRGKPCMREGCSEMDMRINDYPQKKALIDIASLRDAWMESTVICQSATS